MRSYLHVYPKSISYVLVWIYLLCIHISKHAHKINITAYKNLRHSHMRHHEMLWWDESFDEIKNDSSLHHQCAYIDKTFVLLSK